MKAHLVNCTYCEHRVVNSGDKKRSIPEMERCKFTMLPIKKPSEPGRSCEQFHQIEHTCETCWNL
jgi:hypothetical protein